MQMNISKYLCLQPDQFKGKIVRMETYKLAELTFIANILQFLIVS
jgi:hypothetical protein